jgi:predicted PurR-regulated permease PerM
MKELKSLPTYFLLILLVIALYFGYLIFQPYIAVILMAAIFSLLFHPVYSWIEKALLSKGVKGSASIAAFITVLSFVLIIVIPLINFVALLVKESIESYPALEAAFRSDSINTALDQALAGFQSIKDRLPFLDTATFDLKAILLDVSNGFINFIVKNANVVIAGTTNFFVSLFFMLITMYYLLKDGHEFTARIMHLTPLPNKYDKKLFNKFKDVSKSTILSSVITAIIQGVLGGIAFAIAGLPAVLFLTVATAIAALIPFVGTALVWVPIAIVLFFSGLVWQSIFIMIWGVAVIGLSDNLIRTKLIQSSSNIHPLLVFFSIFGGIALWGFLGIIFGPLVLAIILTMLHIYELEYDHILEK